MTLNPKPPFLTDHLKTELENLFTQKHQFFLDDRTFSLEAEANSEAVKVSVILQNKDQSFYYPVEARVLHDQEDMKALEALYFLVDYIDLYFTEFFEEDENLFIPIDWADYEYDCIHFQLRGQILNLKLEREAEKILNQS